MPQGEIGFNVIRYDVNGCDVIGMIMLFVMMLLVVMMLAVMVMMVMMVMMAMMAMTATMAMITKTATMAMAMTMIDISNGFPRLSFLLAVLTSSSSSQKIPPRSQVVSQIFLRFQIW